MAVVVVVGDDVFDLYGSVVFASNAVKKPENTPPSAAFGWP